MSLHESRQIVGCKSTDQIKNELIPIVRTHLKGELDLCSVADFRIFCKNACDYELTITIRKQGEDVQKFITFSSLKLWKNLYDLIVKYVKSSLSKINEKIENPREGNEPCEFLIQKIIDIFNSED